MRYQWQKDEADRKAVYADFLRWKKIVAAKKGWMLSDSRLTGSLINTERANQETEIAQTQINMHIVNVPYREGYVEGSWHNDAVHYQVKIWINGNEKKAFVFAYSQGSGIKQFPTIREILFSFIQGAMLGAQTFQDYCGNTGADSDSIKAQRNYEACNEVLGWFQSNRVYSRQIQTIAETLQEADNRGDINNEALIESVTSGFKPILVEVEDDEDNIPF